MKQTYTPGPWRWEFNEQNKQINLVGGKIRYDLTVMDFVRYGMGGAAPRFNIDHGDELNIMHRADAMGIIVKGREHHKNWFQDIDHPDAKLISAAPELLEALIDLRSLIKSINSLLGHDDSLYSEIAKANQAIIKATK